MKWYIIGFICLFGAHCVTSIMSNPYHTLPFAEFVQILLFVSVLLVVNVFVFES